MSSPTTAPSSHRLPCTAEEAQQIACLNGGTCFAWDAGGGSRHVGCSCTSDWTGGRCEEMQIPYPYGSLSSATGLAVGLVLAGVLIIAVVALVTFYIRRKRRRRRERPTLSSSSSNHASIRTVHVVDGKVPPSNGRQHKSNSEFGSVSQQTVSSILVHDPTPNNSKPLGLAYETQV